MVAESLKLNPLAEAFDPENTTPIVDDCSFNIVATKSLLRQLGTEADSLAHSRSLPSLLQLRDAEGLPMYRLVLLDYSMPDFDGPKCTQMIREFASERGLQQPVIVCITAYAEATFRAAALAAGMDDVLVKPVFKKRMLRVLRKFDLLA